MNNPRRYEASRGDCFFNFFWPVSISLLLHFVVLGGFGFGKSSSPSTLPVERVAHGSSLHLVRLIPRLPPQSRESDKRLPQERPTEGAPPESADFLRSTVKNSPNAATRATNAAAAAERDGDLPAIDAMEAAEYRLALARTLVRLGSGDSNQPVSTGEIFLELIGRQGAGAPVLRIGAFSMLRAESEHWHMLVQAAVEQTPVPVTWSGRSFKLSLMLLVAPIQSAEGSACNSCS